MTPRLTLALDAERSPATEIERQVVRMIDASHRSQRGDENIGDISNLSKTAVRLRALRRDPPGWSTAKNAKWEQKNPEKRRAHRIIELGIRMGRIDRQPCERCGTWDAVHAHHDDYSKPLEVRWLCRLHHRERHKELREGA